MDSNPPTMADIAWDSAQRAARDNGQLQTRVAQLERQVRDLQTQVASLIQALQTRS